GNVFKHRQASEGLHDLKRAHDAERANALWREPDDGGALEADIAGVGPQEPGDEREESRLAGTIWPDDSRDRPAGNRERDRVRGAETAKALGDGHDLKHGAASKVCAAR